MRRLCMAVGLLALISEGRTAAAAAPPPLGPAAIESASLPALADPPSGGPLAAIVKAQVLLARAHVSPGSIDGVDGDTFRQALRAFQVRSGLPQTGRLDQATSDRLAADTAPVIERYRITATDARGPFTPRIPARFEQQSRLPRLGYRDLREALAERFHMSIPLLLGLNRGVPLRAGREIAVAAAEAPRPDGTLARIVVDKTDHEVEAFGPAGDLLAVYPASIGSQEKPAPTGRFEIRRIVHHPDYTYLPQFAFRGVASKTPFRIAPGPNNPVGSVWMDLSYEGYGIHGTPDPEAIGKTQSHGCIRLTNWDAENLAALAEPGTPVFFQDGAADPQRAAPAAPAAAPPAAGQGPAAPEAAPPPAGPAPAQ